MRYAVSLAGAPSCEPITLAEAKLHLRVDADDDDDLITALIQGAREWAENYTRRSFVQRGLELRMDSFPAEILLPRGPVQSVTAVKYTDSAGSLQTVSTDLYQTDLYGTPPRIVLVSGATWPTPKLGAVNAVLVQYTAGYPEPETSPQGMADNVPAAVKAAIKILVGYWYENREAAAQVPMAVKALLAPFEIRDLRLEA